MRKHWILFGLLLLCLVPLSCSQKECEWRDIAKFANHEVEYSQGLPFTVVSGNSTLTEPFSVHEGKLQIFCASSSSDVGSDGSLVIDLYHYPDMKFVKTAVDDAWRHGEFTDVVKYLCFASVEKGMYCLYVSSNHVSWGVTVSECA